MTNQQRQYRPSLDWTPDTKLPQRFARWKEEMEDEILLFEGDEKSPKYICNFIKVCSGRLSSCQEYSRERLLNNRQQVIDKYNEQAKNRSDLQEMQKVWFQKDPNQPRWEEATVVQVTDQPRSYVVQKGDGAQYQRTSRHVRPAAQKQDAPAAPKQDAPAAPKQDAPAAPKQDAPAAPKQDAPAAPKQDAPAAPKQDAPAAPKQDAPAAPKQDAPCCSKARCSLLLQSKMLPAAPKQDAPCCSKARCSLLLQSKMLLAAPKQDALAAPKQDALAAPKQDDASTEMIAAVAPPVVSESPQQTQPYMTRSGRVSRRPDRLQL
ncbi:hypothetical protein CAPTEDRAFT_205902 [Capitella teleta]|uniref:Uncharacterized protein n=1 Tax=Capitella teleta TaxID=283909 RepID=R7UFG9_CAPTE|nr:hypothetical protein CAPTEDRAFT_205902 [Capitella teleta]|eukprot:ELU04853.1 hypothetical protein CAPTEDRAFT_205902 [Capitella teleta]